MNTFRYFMPVDTYFGRDCIAEHKDVMKKLGQKALIVTGRTSAKKNGSQQDVTDALEALGMQWVLFDEIGDNVLECNSDTITLIEDYRDDILQILGGKGNE